MPTAAPQDEPARPTDAEPEAVYDDADERLITERLQALGYIE